MEGVLSALLHLAKQILKTNLHPHPITKENILNFSQKQLAVHNLLKEMDIYLC